MAGNSREATVWYALERHRIGDPGQAGYIPGAAVLRGWAPVEVVPSQYGWRVAPEGSEDVLLTLTDEDLQELLDAVEAGDASVAPPAVLAVLSQWLQERAGRGRVAERAQKPAQAHHGAGMGILAQGGE